MDYLLEVLKGFIYFLAYKVYYVMRCAILYNPYNLKNLRNSLGGVLLLVKLEAKRLQLY